MLVSELNEDESVDGIFVQTPFRYAVPYDLVKISPKKDVDSQSFESIGQLFFRGVQPWKELTSVDALAVVTAAIEVYRSPPPPHFLSLSLKALLRKVLSLR